MLYSPGLRYGTNTCCRIFPFTGRWDDEVEKPLKSVLSAKGAPFVFSPLENRLDNSARDSFVDGPHTPDVTTPCLVPTITTRLNASRASLFFGDEPQIFKFGFALGNHLPNLGPGGICSAAMRVWKTSRGWLGT